MDDSCAVVPPEEQQQMKDEVGADRFVIEHFDG